MVLYDNRGNIAHARLNDGYSSGSDDDYRGAAG